MMNITKINLIVIFTIAIFIPSIGFTANDDKNDRNPVGCKDVGYKFDLRALDLYPGSIGERNSLYFVYNKTNQPINLHQLRAEDSARSVHLDHEVGPDRWAVLSTNEKNVKYACTKPDSKLAHGRLVDCAESIKVCEFARVRYGLNNRGNYWVVRGNTRSGAVREVVWYGIIPQ